MLPRTGSWCHGARPLRRAAPTLGRRSPSGGPTAWERQLGTIPLILASPTALAAVFAGRSAQWIVDGIVVVSVSLAVLSPAFGLELDPWGVAVAIPVLVITCLSVYGLGLVLAAASLYRPTLRNILSNTAGVLLAIVAGVQVPVADLPAFVSVLSNVVPLTHGLAAIRLLTAGIFTTTTVLNVLLEAAIGCAYFAAATFSFVRIGSAMRTNGVLE